MHMPIEIFDDFAPPITTDPQAWPRPRSIVLTLSEENGEQILTVNKKQLPLLKVRVV
jgi:hypothetical protein